MMAIPNMKPCPFCGGTAEIRSRFIKGVANRKHYWLECGQCHIQQNHVDGYRTIDKAVKIWNRRTSDDSNT